MEVKKRTKKRLRPASGKLRLTSKERVRKRKLKLLNSLVGIGKDVWNEDAQVYVNRLRDNDRF